MEYKIKSRIWIEVDGEILLGEGRVQLLKSIAETGSLTKAAASLNMSYKKAWSLVDAVNTRAKKAVVRTAIGGTKGGGTEITEYGRTLIKTFDNLNEKCWAFLDEQLANSEL